MSKQQKGYQFKMSEVGLRELWPLDKEFYELFYGDHRYLQTAQTSMKTILKQFLPNAEVK